MFDQPQLNVEVVRIAAMYSDSLEDTKGIEVEKSIVWQSTNSDEYSNRDA